MNKHEPTSFETAPDRRASDTQAVDDRAPEPIDSAHRAAIEAGLADMRAGRIASVAEIDAVYARFGRGAR